MPEGDQDHRRIAQAVATPALLRGRRSAARPPSASGTRAAAHRRLRLRGGGTVPFRRVGRVRALGRFWPCFSWCGYPHCPIKRHLWDSISDRHRMGCIAWFAPQEARPGSSTVAPLVALPVDLRLLTELLHRGSRRLRASGHPEARMIRQHVLFVRVKSVDVATKTAAAHHAG